MPHRSLILRLILVAPWVLLCLPVPAMAQADQQVVGLVTHGTDGGQYLGVVTRQRKSDGSLLPVTTIRFRPLAGKADSWLQYAEFDARILALAEWGGDLAVLLEAGGPDSGKTQLRFVHNPLERGRQAEDVPGPRLPAGVTALDISGGAGGGPLLALAREETGTGVWALTGTQWNRLADLPERVATVDPAGMDIAGLRQRALLAARVAPGTLALYEEADGAWRELGEVSIGGEERFLLIDGPQLRSPTIYIWGEADRLVQLKSADEPQSADVSFNLPPNLKANLEADDPRAAALAMGSIRLERAAVRGEEGKGTQPVLLELAIDPATFQPVGDGNAVPLTFLSVTAEEMRERIITLLLYGLLVVALVAVRRQRPLPPADRLRDVAQHLAPLPQRAAAGIVDALPVAFSVALWWASQSRLGGAGEAIILGAGVLVYFAHLMAAEAATGRSLGKAMFGLKVVRTDGSEAGPGAIVLRNLLRPLDIPTAGLGLALLNPLRQRLGDMAAGTTVVLVRPNPEK